LTFVSSLSGVVPAIIDTHIHQWDPFTTPREAARLAPLYRRTPRLMTALLPLLVSRDIRDMVRTPEHVAQSYLPGTYAADVAGVPDAVGVPVEATIHVQAEWLEKGPLGPAGETRWLETLPFGDDGNPRLAAIVAHADPRSDHLDELLDAHAAASPRFRGIRCMGTWHDDPKVKRYADRPGLFRSAEFLKGFAAIAERGLTFDAYVYSHQLDDVAVLAAEYPDTTIVLDHYAPPVGWLGPMGKTLGRNLTDRADVLASWRDGIAALGAHSNVVAKHSGLAFPMLGMPTRRMGRAEITETVAPLVEHTTDVFGPDRLMFGSNFPMDKAISEYADVVGALVDLLAPQGEELLGKVFRENAQRVYSL
jgi:predicted TIM-barrel fold metal-dependent hydrolase